MLVKLQMQGRLVNGTFCKVGEVCNLPDDLATVLKQKGFAIAADGAEHLKAAEVKVAKRAAKKAKKAKGK